jgi:hypothetical protein
MQRCAGIANRYDRVTTRQSESMHPTCLQSLSFDAIFDIVPSFQMLIFELQFHSTASSWPWMPT